MTRSTSAPDLCLLDAIAAYLETLR